MSEESKFSFPRTRSFRVGGKRFVVDRKYRPLKGIGKGGYGIVCLAEDTSNGNRKVAIKKCHDVFRKRLSAKRIIREVQLLKHFDHKNMIGLYDVLIPPPESLDDESQFQDIYLVMDFMPTDMAQIIDDTQNLSDTQIKYFTYQLITALLALHKAGVIHRDVKPSNILLDEACQLRLCDFGLARWVGSTDISPAASPFESPIKGNRPSSTGDPDSASPPKATSFPTYSASTEIMAEPLTTYVVTRWYRAPELLCSNSTYDSKVDMWSVGCILLELFERYPLFQGSSSVDQLSKVLDVIGRPSEEAISRLSNHKARHWLRSHQSLPKVPLHNLYPHIDPLALNLIDKLLQFDPRERLSAEQALHHPWLASFVEDSRCYAELSESLTQALRIRPFSSDLDDCKSFSSLGRSSDISSLKMRLWEEIQGFHPSLPNPSWGRTRSLKNIFQQDSGTSVETLFQDNQTAALNAEVTAVSRRLDLTTIEGITPTKIIRGRRGVTRGEAIGKRPAQLEEPGSQASKTFGQASREGEEQEAPAQDPQKMSWQSSLDAATAALLRSEDKPVLPLAFKRSSSDTVGRTRPFSPPFAGGTTQIGSLYHSAPIPGRPKACKILDTLHSPQSPR